MGRWALALSAEEYSLHEPIGTDRGDRGRGGASHQRRASERADVEQRGQRDGDRHGLAELDAEIEADERAHQGPTGKRQARERVGKAEPMDETEHEGHGDTIPWAPLA